MTNQGLDDIFDKAARQFNSSVKALDQDVNRLEKWLDTQPHLPKMLDKYALRNFLILNKCSIEVAKQKIDNYYTFRSKVPEIAYEINPKLPCMKAFNDMVYLVDHPQVTDAMYKLTFFKVKGETLSKNYEPIIFSKKFFTMKELQLRRDVVCGDLFVIDLQGFTLNAALKITPTLIHKSLVLYEKIFSLRIKGVHLVNVTPALVGVVNTIKSFLKPKLAERFHVHSEINDLKKVVPLSLLPVDFGGEGLCLRELEDALETKYVENQELFDLLDEIKVDEDLRPEKLEDDTWGIFGNFKKIDVD